jgi:hypothetical protein
MQISLHKRSLDGKFCQISETLPGGLGKREKIRRSCPTERCESPRSSLTVQHLDHSMDKFDVRVSSFSIDLTNKPSCDNPHPEVEGGNVRQPAGVLSSDNWRICEP